MIPIAKPNLGPQERKAVIEVLKSGMIAQGPKVAQLEEKFAHFIGTKYAIAVSSGTTALHLALLALGIGEGDEVIVPSFTFIATANAPLFVGAKPIFADIDEQTFNIDPIDIEKKITKKTKAIIPVHLFGRPADMKQILALAKKHKLYVIEDAAQAHGAEIKGKKIGSFSEAGCFSFYPTKNMTTSEGGMVTTNNEKLAQKIHLLREHGMPKKYHHEMLGYNFRMTDIAAAIGLEQLKKLRSFNAKRITNAKYLNNRLGKIKGIIIPEIELSTKHVFHQYTIRITKDYLLTREQLMQKLEKAGIGFGIFYPIPCHQQKEFKDMKYKVKLPVTEEIVKEVLSLPVHPLLIKKDLDLIIRHIK